MFIRNIVLDNHLKICYWIFIIAQQDEFFHIKDVNNIH